MTTIAQGVKGFNNFFRELKAAVGSAVTQWLEEQLEAEVSSWLQRGHHQRRGKVGQRRTQAVCRRCGTHLAKAFSRNGHRLRQLVTTYGVLNFWLPRVVCECGGSVHIPFSILTPWQRLWDDVVEQVEGWARLGLSLRQMQGELGERLGTQVGLRTLNACVGTVSAPLGLALTSVPPVVMLDAIWLTLLTDTSHTQPDRLGRQRRVKARHKVCVLVALGLYPQTQRWGILGWAVADSESQAAWERLLVPLEQRGLYRERGLELFIHDGGSGLIAALNLLYPHIPHQRCLFHKLRNLWHAIHPPPAFARPDAQAFKRDLLQQVATLFYAPSADEAAHLRDTFCDQWRGSQPNLVDTLRRDWQDSIAAFRVLARFPNWPRTCLRTTSLLERLNRTLRRYFRAASAYHSQAGLIAAVTRVLAPIRLI
jgi:Transposase, Mutator family